MPQPKRSQKKNDLPHKSKSAIKFKKTNKLIYAKIPKHKYTLEQLDKAIELLKQNENDIENISNLTEMSNRRVKTIRWILKKGSESDIELLRTTKYIISSIKNQINLNKKLLKKVKNGRPLDSDKNL